MVRVFPHLKNKKDEGRQNHKSRHKNDEYKNKKKAKVMQTMWSIESDSRDADDLGAELGDEELNLALLAQVE
jgi:hypothetical protein